MEMNGRYCELDEEYETDDGLKNVTVRKVFNLLTLLNFYPTFNIYYILTRYSCKYVFLL